MTKMRLGDADYDALVRKFMHKLTVLSVEECAKEIADITGGAVSSFADGRYIPPDPQPTQVTNIPKRRGRPPGSRNKPKESK